MRRVLKATAFACLFCSAPTFAERPIQFVTAASDQGGALVVPLRSAAELDRLALDPAVRAAIIRASAAEKFDFTADSTLLLRAIGPWQRILIIGLGPDAIGPKGLQDVGGRAALELHDFDAPITILASGLSTAAPEAAADIALGTRLGGYRFDKYKSPDPKKPVSQAPIVIVSDGPGAEAAFRREGTPLAEGINFARDLIREPANVVYPESFVERTQAAFRGLPNVTITVIDERDMARLGMGSILSVGKGSVRPPRMMIVRYSGAPSAPLVALAGKGITFDSGGVSLKPGPGMWAMKGDMAGAAGVVGTVLSLAKARAPVNVAAIAALAENMPGGGASRPGDVVRAYDGQTIEILNTDAEGRLVLADAVAYAERVLRPAAIVDMATLTGSVGTALGDEYAGLLTRNDALAAQLLAAGKETGEELWRLPLHPSYAKDMKSDIADIKNVVEGGTPGAGFGAHFIGFFVKATPWAHLDIASLDLRKTALPTVPEGLSGFGVRLLDRFVRDFRAPPAGAATAK